MVDDGPSSWHSFDIPKSVEGLTTKKIKNEKKNRNNTDSTRLKDSDSETHTKQKSCVGFESTYSQRNVSLISNSIHFILAKMFQRP